MKTYKKIKEKVLENFKKYFPHDPIETPTLAIIDYTFQECNKRVEKAIDKKIKHYEKFNDMISVEIKKELKRLKKDLEK